MVPCHDAATGEGGACDGPYTAFRALMSTAIGVNTLSLTHSAEVFNYFASGTAALNVCPVTTERQSRLARFGT